MELRPGQKLIGAWLDETPFIASRITIYEDNGHVYLNHKYMDGSGRSEEVSVNENALGSRFRTQQQRRGPEGVYCLLSANGHLQLRDNEGLISTAKRLKP